MGTLWDVSNVTHMVYMFTFFREFLSRSFRMGYVGCYIHAAHVLPVKFRTSKKTSTRCFQHGDVSNLNDIPGPFYAVTKNFDLRFCMWWGENKVPVDANIIF